MRDVALTAFIALALPFALAHPYIGVLLWTWIGLMNPHRETWGFAQSLPFAQIVAIVVLISLFVSRDRKWLPVTPFTVWLGIFIGWMLVTSAVALYPGEIREQFEKVMKVMLFIYITIAVFNDKKRLDLLIWVIVLSLGFYSVKGGLYTLTTGGVGRVFGPAGGFAAENNSFAVAALMIVPLAIYLYMQNKNRYIRWGLLGGALLSCISALGSQSRGALIAIAAVALFFWLKSQRKVAVLVLLVPVAIGTLTFMPDSWWNRMNTITTYEKDGSAMGRLNAWSMAWNLAKDRVTGGGFYVFDQELFDKYSNNPADGVRAAHSIYFQILGEHGFIGLAIFLAMWASVWIACRRLIRQARSGGDVQWAGDLARMVQVSLIAYLAGGAFLSLAYFDLSYILAAVIVIAQKSVGAVSGGATKNREMSPYAPARDSTRIYN